MSRKDVVDYLSEPLQKRIFTSFGYSISRNAFWVALLSASFLWNIFDSKFFEKVNMWIEIGSACVFFVLVYFLSGISFRSILRTMEDKPSSHNMLVAAYQHRNFALALLFLSIVPLYFSLTLHNIPLFIIYSLFTISGYSLSMGLAAMDTEISRKFPKNS